MMNKKGAAILDMLILVVSIFAFSYLISQNAENVVVEEKSAQPTIVAKILEKLLEPMIPLASAEALGCCSRTTTGVDCVTATEEYCAEGEDFLQEVSCESTAYCRRGCCYDEDLGIYDKNVLQKNCGADWIADATCNVEGAELGCCYLGGETLFETEGQCRVDTEERALGGEGGVDWEKGVSEVECILLSSNQKEGACVYGETCEFGTEAECVAYGGNFYEDYLCTAAELNTTCEPTTETTCVDGKDGVYFLDSCGNVANIYDSSRVNDDSYWENVVSPLDSCGLDSRNGNANSEGCGNCGRFAGGICSSAVEDDFDVDYGNYYCEDTSCTFDGVQYENGESWCVYDGKIGDGDDIAGSRHWKYVCNYGEVSVEPCADYRSEICVQSNTLDENDEIIFRNANCRTNNARSCIALNSEKDGIKQCKDELDCEVTTIDVDGSFNFQLCTPVYPKGFNLNSQSEISKAEEMCGLATRTCTVTYASTTWGGCECVDNCECEDADFINEMNDLCRSLGDCGLEANVVGEIGDSYKFTNDGDREYLSENYVSGIERMADADNYPGQYAEVGDVEKYLIAAGIINEYNLDDTSGEISTVGNYIGMGAGAVGTISIAVAAALDAGVVSEGAAILAEFGSGGANSAAGAVGSGGGAVAAVAPFAGAAIGAGIGMAIGGYLAQAGGASSGWAIVAMSSGAIAGALIGWAAGAAVAAEKAVILLCVVCPWCCIVAAVFIIIMIVSAFFMSQDCETFDIEYTCKPWSPPSGSSDCELCNDDPLKPCSEYRCGSLGAGCEYINEGTTEEMCTAAKDNGGYPKISLIEDSLSPTETYDKLDSSGFDLVSAMGDSCIGAYTPIYFTLETDEPAYCKYDLSQTEYENMGYDAGSGTYVLNHTVGIVLPDPSHGESQGFNVTEDMTMYIKCQDRFGHETPSFYTVDLCVKEGEDFTAPLIRYVSPYSGRYVSYESEEVDFQMYTNEVSICRWDLNDTDYGNMEGEFECETDITQMENAGYSCSGGLPVESGENKYYIRCMDQPWLTDGGNANAESYEYILNRVEQPIYIKSIEPNEDFESGTMYSAVDLEVETKGGGEVHLCSYSFSGYGNMIDFFDTSIDTTHVQPLSLSSGKKKIYVRCEDETGDFAQNETSFEVTYDTSTPAIARLWQDGNYLKFITTEDSECKYSTEDCGFTWSEGEDADDGEIHSISAIKGFTYYVRCEDEYGNAPSGCSISATAT